MKHALLVLAVTASVRMLAAPGEYDLRAHYVKHEYRIPMRDGATLFTAVYVPKDTSVSHPFLMERTPYSVAPYGEDQYAEHIGPDDAFEESGYIFVLQDVRGRYQSDGPWELMRPHIDHPKPGQTDESTDTYDTVEWLLKTIPGNNGRVGMWGVSWPGFFAAASMIDTHPAIVACSPQAPMTALNLGDDDYHNGAFMLDANFSFHTGFRPTKPRSSSMDSPQFTWGEASSYDFFLKAGPLAEMDGRYLHHEAPDYTDSYLHTSDDAFWKARNLALHLHNVRCAVLLVGGLFDGEDIAGPVREYHALKALSPETDVHLVEGPWFHTGWLWTDGSVLGSVHFGSKTGEYFRKNVQFPFFEHALKDAPDPRLPDALVFETGSNRWRRYEQWPPLAAKPKRLYLHLHGGLSFQPQAVKDIAWDEYVSDPAHPVPSVGYAYIGEVPAEHMVADQRYASSRPDVLVYQTAPLEADVTVAGPVRPHLVASTSGTDSDWDVKLIDVYPADAPEAAEGPPPPGNDIGAPGVRMAGFQQLVRGEPMRGKFRHGFDRPEPFTPNKPEVVDFSMPDVNHTFLKGHRIMVQVQSSWFPLTDLNPQVFTDIPNASRGSFQKATQQVYPGSYVEVGVMPTP